MGASVLMSLGMRAMTASYAALQTTSHNIANANVEGYSRQQVELATSRGQFTGSGFFGKGVDVQTVTRAHDAFLTREAVTAKSLASMDRVRLEQLQQLEHIFKPGEQGIGFAAGQFLGALSDLASRPADHATRQVVLARAAETADRFATAGSQLDSLQNGVSADLRTMVDRVNEMASRIADLNKRISSLSGLDHRPNDLLDQRDRLVAQIAELVHVNTIEASDRSLAIFIAGGQRLVLGADAQKLIVMSDADDSSRAALGLDDNGERRRIGAAELGGGSIAGMLRFQNEDLVDAQTLLGQIAAALAGRVNQQQSFGLDLRNPPGSGAPIFAAGAPQALPAASNRRAPGGAFIGRVDLGVTDATQLIASEYELRADPASAGAWQLTRLADGLVRSVASGDSVDGMRIDVSGAASTDRFRLQPVTRAAHSMRRVIDHPDGIAAASPLTATVAAGNTGTATVASMRVVSASSDSELSASISFTSGSGDYDWQLRDRVSGSLVSSGSGRWDATAPIALNGFELALNGMPRSGDVLNVSKTLQPGSNNGNALALAALRDEALVGRFLDGGVVGGGSTLTDAYAAAMADVGVRVQGSVAASDISGAIATQTESARLSKSGVNLDEEAARLIQHQQSYQAAAKVLQVAQSVFDTLLQTATG